MTRLPTEAPPRYWFRKRYADTVQRLRVASGFILLGAFAWLSYPVSVSLAIGLPISVFGLALRAWAAGHLTKDRELATSGPYAYIRNPLYVGSLIAAFGLVIAARSTWLFVVFAMVFLLIYLPTVELEEQHLRDIFAGYPYYAARVRRFIPVSRYSGTRRSFSFRLYRRNEEYKASLGFLIAVGWLTYRAARA